MARPKKIDVLTLEDYGITVQIYLDKDSGEFTAEYDGAHRRSTQLALLRKEMTKLVRERNNLAWHPFIEVQFLRPEHRRDVAFVGFVAKRLHLAQKGQEIAQQDWAWNDSDKPDLTMRGTRYFHWSGPLDPAATQASDFVGTHYCVLPYTPELWARLEEIQNGIRAIKSALQELIQGGPEHILTYSRSLALPSTTKENPDHD